MRLALNYHWIIAISCFVFAALFLVYRCGTMFRTGRLPSVTTEALAAIFLIIFAILTALPEPGIWQLRLSGVAALQMGLLLGIIVIAQLGHIPVRRTPVYGMGGIVIIVCLYLGWHTRDNIVLFTDQPTFLPTFPYIAYFGLSQLSFALLTGTLALLCIASLRHYPQPHQKFRHTVHSMAYTITALACGIAAFHIGLFLVRAPDRIPSATLNMLYHGGKNIGSILLMAVLILPDSFFRAITMPFQRYIDAKRQPALQVLHTTLLQLVPGVHLPVPSADLHAVRMPIEINDARDVVWSHMGYEGILTPAAEAQQLRALASVGRIFAGTGPYDPPATQHDNDTHIQQVATYLLHWKEDHR